MFSEKRERNGGAKDELLERVERWVVNGKEFRGSTPVATYRNARETKYVSSALNLELEPDKSPTHISYSDFASSAPKIPTSTHPRNFPPSPFGGP